MLFGQIALKNNHYYYYYYYYEYENPSEIMMSSSIPNLKQSKTMPDVEILQT